VDFEGNPFKLKFYSPLKNTTKGVYLAKGGNILEYKVKANALSNTRSSHLSTTLALHLIQKSKHKRKKEKTPPLEIHNEVQKDFILVRKKCFTEHGGQTIKQVLKLKRILKHTASLEPITWEKLQHSGIGSHLFYFNLQYYNVSLSLDKI
jgi:hypothetical protein